MKIKRKWALPDGTDTTNVKKYIKEWKAISDPICKHLNVELVGFNPGFLFRFENDTIDMPTKFAIDLSNKLKDLEYYG